jgi:hypothetical protein
MRRLGELKGAGNMTITIEMAPDLEQQLQDAAAQAGLEPDVYIVETLREHLAHPDAVPARRPPDAQHLSAAEARLLLKINQSLDGIAWARYHALVVKRRAEALTPDEQQELIALADQIETANAQRMTYLAELARLRNISLPMLIQQLGLKPNAMV